jgi:hypothetical protein
MKKSIAFVCLILLFVCAKAQTKDLQTQKSFWQKMHYTVSLGFQHNEALQGYSILGKVQMEMGKHWQLGIGTGLDKYSVATIPVFLSSKYVLSPNTHSLFFFGDLGLSCNKNKLDPVRLSQWGSIAVYEKSNPGFYGSLGAGYQFKANGRTSFQMSMGYTITNMTFYYLEAKLPVDPYNSFYEDATRHSFSYEWGRLFFRMGIVF